MHALLAAVAQLVMVADRVKSEHRRDPVACLASSDAVKMARHLSQVIADCRADVIELADALDAISPGSCAGVRAALGGE